MKKNKLCPKCESTRIGYLEALPDKHEWGPDWRVSQQSIGATPEPEKKKWHSNLPYREYGVEAYVCTECGFYETYVRSPTEVPFEELPGFHWVNPEQSSGPFR